MRTIAANSTRHRTSSILIRERLEGDSWALLHVVVSCSCPCFPKTGFALGKFVRANKQKANVIGW